MATKINIRERRHGFQLNALAIFEEEKLIVNGPCDTVDPRKERVGGKEKKSSRQFRVRTSPASCH